MRYSQLFAPTLREVSVEMTGHRLLLRAGFIRQLAAGVYSFLPLGWRVLNRISEIVREEMRRAGAQELLMPAMIPRELFAEGGRETAMEDVLIGFKDRKGAGYYLGPTHEEVITDLVRKNVHSYRDLPLKLFQIQMKYRDEPRPRGGLIRAREFLMKDAYSFDRDDAGLSASYHRMYESYLTIFQRMGLAVTPVAASGGAIGGKETLEFMLLTEAGEDTILRCPHCGYAANQEIADFLLPDAEFDDQKPMARVETPEAHTVQQVCDFLHTGPERLVKTLIYLADGQPVAALLRGDRVLNEERFRTLLGAARLEMATPEQILNITGGPVGFSGPGGLAIPLYGDEEVRGMVNFITGANQRDMHLVNVNWSAVESEIVWAHLRLAVAGDRCPNCATPLEECRGMELGHIFKQRSVISEPLHAVFTDEDGSEKLMLMGCYGIGVSRLLAAVAEVSNDEHGLIWPMSLAPFTVHLIVINTLDPVLLAFAEGLYDRLSAAGIEVLYDDRNERPGVKFNDADLIGIPLQIVAGKMASQGQVEMRDRATKASEIVAVEDVLAKVRERMYDALRA